MLLLENCRDSILCHPSKKLYSNQMWFQKLDQNSKTTKNYYLKLLYIVKKQNTKKKKGKHRFREGKTPFTHFKSQKIPSCHGYQGRSYLFGLLMAQRGDGQAPSATSHATCQAGTEQQMTDLPGGLEVRTSGLGGDGGSRGVFVYIYPPVNRGSRN